MTALTRAANWWALGGVALALSVPMLEEHLWVMAGLPVLAWAIGGLAILGVAWSRLGSPESRPQALRAGGIVLAVVAMYLPLSSLSTRATQRLRFARERAAYERIVSEVRTNPPHDPPHKLLERDGLSYAVDPGPPLRVAFLWPGGVVDNWCGAVFDPFGDVMGINELELGTPAWRNHPTTKLFGGDMTGCRPLDDAYYLCCFT